MNANDQANYADMIEVPVNTCTVTAVPAPKKRGKRKKQVDNEAVKASVIDSVNKRQEDLLSTAFNPLSEDEKDAVLDVVKNKNSTFADGVANDGVNLMDGGSLNNGENSMTGETLNSGTGRNDNEILLQEMSNIKEQMDIESAVTSANILTPDRLLGDNKNSEKNNTAVKTVTVKDRKKRFSLKGKILALSLIVGVVGVATVGGALLTDGLGLTSYFNGVFSADEGIEVLEYNDYTAYLPCGAKGAVSLADGVMSVTHKGSVYASTDGTVSMISKEGETYVLEITHGDDFKTVITGIDHAYVAKGDQIFGNIPIGYSNGNGYTVCLYSADGLITEYDISGGTVVWKSTTDGEVAG